VIIDKRNPMEINTSKLRELLDKRDKLDDEIYGLVTGRQKKALRCSICSEESHTARNCPNKDKPEPTKPSF